MRRRPKYVGGALVALVLALGCRKAGERGGSTQGKVDTDNVPPPTISAGSTAEAVTLDLGGGVTMELVRIPAGEFTMGSPAPEKDRTDDETQHRVKITKPFYMGKHEVTQAQYERVMGTNPSHFKGADLPVEQVTWNDATEFCRELSRRIGKTVRLPTEAEWEYACRAGTSTPFHYGNSLGSNQANFVGKFPYGGAAKGVHREKTTTVGSFAANAWGLHDMHGNVREWCSDWHDERHYGTSPAQDPSGPTNGSLRVLRGGCWFTLGFSCRSASRDWGDPTRPINGFGFRVAGSLSPRRDARAVPPERESGKAMGPPSEVKKHLAHVPALTLDLGGGVTMEFVRIPAGEFMMGSPGTESGRDDDEGPQHRVRITKPFCMGKHEVTQAQYERIMGTNPSTRKGADLPVGWVTWYNATEFCRKLSERTGRTARLPTEAEWEYACRAGTTTPFHCGSSLSSAQASFDGDHPYGGAAKGPDRRKTTSVGSFAANAWGLHDMHGNVWEWCADWYGNDYYGKSPGQDPTGPVSGGYRVLRGGSWNDNGHLCRSAYRCKFGPTYRLPNTGLRVVVVPSPER